MARQTGPSLNHRLANECLAMRIRTLDRAITNLYDVALRPLGLKVTQLDILLIVSKLGVARPSEICEILRMDTSTLSRNAERLLSRGWLEIVPRVDARAQPLRLTRRGQKLIEQAYPAWEHAPSQVQELLGNSGTSALMKAAARVGLGKNFSNEPSMP
jgi:DNA-binding MarR family transcriptional regulator